MRLPEVIAAGALALALCAATPPVSAAADGPAAWLLSLGGDIDEDGGYRADAGVIWAPSLVTSLTAQAGSADTSTDLEHFKADLATIGFDHFFGRFGMNVDARWWDQHDLFSSTTLGATLYYREADWRVGLRAEARRSDLDQFDFSAVVPIRNVLVPITGQGKCSLENTALGITVSRTGKAWSGLVSGINYDYSTADCDLTGVALPTQAGNLPPISRELFRRLATRVLQAGAQLIGSELTRENGFLDYTVWGALGYRSSLMTLGVDYYHDREEFAGEQADTLIGSITFPVSDRLDLELRIGASDSDIEGRVVFAGLTLLAYLGSPP